MCKEARKGVGFWHTNNGVGVSVSVDVCAGALLQVSERRMVTSPKVVNQKFGDVTLYTARYFRLYTVATCVSTHKKVLRL